MARPRKHTVPPLTYSAYRISIKAVDIYIKESVSGGDKTEARKAVASILLGRAGDPLREYWRAVREERSYGVSARKAEELLARVPESPVVEPEKFLARLAPAPSFRVNLSPRDADAGEIEVAVEASDNLIDPSRFPIASRYAAVYVDQVRFFQKRKGGPPVVSEGEYLRIEIPSGLHGAVVLPVEVDTGDVLLVTQYRHAPQRYITECPRGFGHIAADQSEIDTARRELLQETGRVPVVSDGVEELYLLKDTYTDTGKLWEKPALFLAFVRREPYGAYINQLNPAMEDPVWVNLARFVRSLYFRTEIQLVEGEFAFVLPPRHLDRMRPRTPISEGRLAIEDAFTLQAGLLALPHLVRRFGKQILADLFD